MFRNTKRHSSEEEFLHAIFYEFVKCWGSSCRSRLFIESVNRNAFVNFSDYLGYPRKTFFFPKKENTKETNFNCNSNSTPKKKSAWKTKRDNLRAAKFQAKRLKKVAYSPTAAVPTSSPSIWPLDPTQHPLNFKFSTPTMIK